MLYVFWGHRGVNLKTLVLLRLLLCTVLFINVNKKLEFPFDKIPNKLVIIYTMWHVISFNKFTKHKDCFLYFILIHLNLTNEESYNILYIIKRIFKLKIIFKSKYLFL